jgi:hypothetical protein
MVQRGWAVRTLPIGHLRQLHDPDLVAETLHDLLGQIVALPLSEAPRRLLNHSLVALA